MGGPRLERYRRWLDLAKSHSRGDPVPRAPSAPRVLPGGTSTAPRASPDSRGVPARSCGPVELLGPRPRAGAIAPQGLAARRTERPADQPQRRTPRPFRLGKAPFLVSGRTEARPRFYLTAGAPASTPRPCEAWDSGSHKERRVNPFSGSACPRRPIHVGPSYLRGPRLSQRVCSGPVNV